MKKPFYVHYRAYNGRRGVLPQGGVTLSCAPSKLGDGLDVGIAVCCELDNYCKARGRMIADGRRRVGRFAWASTEDGQMWKDLDLIAIAAWAEVHHLRQTPMPALVRGRGLNTYTVDTMKPNARHDAERQWREA